MKHSKKIFSVILVLSLTFSLVLSAFASEPTSNIATTTESQKVSDELLEILNISYEDLKDGNFTDHGDTYSCIIWIEDIAMEAAVMAGIDAAEMTRDTYSASATYDYPYTVMDVEGIEVVEVELNENESAEYVDAYIEAERAVAADMYQSQNNSFVTENFDLNTDISHSAGISTNADTSTGNDDGTASIHYISSYSPCIFAELSIAKIAGLMEQEDVQRIGYWNADLITDMGDADGEALFTDIDKAVVSASLMELAKVDTAKSDYGVNGAGVIIGQYEKGCPTDSTVEKNTTYGRTSNHADNVYYIMHEVAPNATYYACGMTETVSSVDCSKFAYPEQIEWLITEGVNVINMSTGWTDGEYSNVYGEISRWLDHIAYNHDVHIVAASGNFGGTGGVSLQGMAYNVITVGATDSAGVICEISSYSTATPSRINFQTHKPDIVAPGTIRTDLAGTSYAAPMVTGTVALMCGYQPALKTKQFIVKAILAAATSKDRRYVTTDSAFTQYGAGLLNARSAIWIIYRGRYSYSTGYFASTSTSFTKTYSMTVSSTDTTMRVALAYSNAIKYGAGDKHDITDSAPDSGSKIAELTLTVKDPNGNVVASCTKEGTNLKIVQFNVSAYGTYTIEVTQTIAADGGRTTNFGVAWY